MSDADPKTVYKEKMQSAVENFMTAEHEGAEQLAPDTYAWAKAKLYDNKKIILQYPDDEKKVEEATDDAAAAAAKLLATVREKVMKEPKPDVLPPEKVEKEAIKVLDNEGGPIV